jgi:hypothetical protein
MRFFQADCCGIRILQAAGIQRDEKLGAQQAPLNDMDQLMKVQAFIPRDPPLQKICIEVGNAIIIAALEFLETA